MIKKTIIAIATIAVIAPTMALASEHKKEAAISYIGPVDVVTVAELLEDTSMFAERNAIVEGKLIRQIDADTFTFSDGTKEIQVEFDDDIGIPQSIDATTQLRLFGEYEGGRTPEIEIERLQIL